MSSKYLALITLVPVRAVALPHSVFTISTHASYWAFLVPPVQNKNLPVLSIDTMSLHLIRSLISVCNALFYQETWRQKYNIKAGQLPQQEVERFTKESKALKTTVNVVGAVVLWFQCRLTSLLFISSAARDKCEKTSLHHVFLPLIRTCDFLSDSLSLFVPQQGSLRKSIVGDIRTTCPRQVRRFLARGGGVCTQANLRVEVEMFLKHFFICYFVKPGERQNKQHYRKLAFNDFSSRFTVNILTI